MPNPKITALRSILDSRFPASARKSGSGVSTGVRAIDEALGGGLPPGRLTELVSERAGSGGQLALSRLLTTTRQARQRVALIDAVDGFSPEHVSEDTLRHLVWVRPQTFAQTLAAADILVRDGNYSVLVLDLRGISDRELLNTPKSNWHRLQRAAESRPTAVLVQTTRGAVPAVPWRLMLRSTPGLSVRRIPQWQILESLTVEVLRGHQAYDEEMTG